jgi:GT2 family glycosyltransferase
MSQDAELVDFGVLDRLWQCMKRDRRVAVIHPLSVFEDNEEYNVSKRYSPNTSRLQSVAPGPKASDTLELSSAEIARCNALVRRWRGPDAKQGLWRVLGVGHACSTDMWSFPLTFAMIRLDVLRLLGGFDTRFWYCHENNDYALRAMDRGFVIARANRTFVNHRRFAFRAAGLPGEALALNQRGVTEGARVWTEKWGKPYRSLLRERGSRG